MIVYLKSIDGTKTRFESMKQMFEYLESEIASSGRIYSHHSCGYKHNMSLIIGDSFKSEAKRRNVGYKDLRNPACCISRKFSEFEKDGSVFSGAIRHDLWLAVDNKYIVLDDKGRVISRGLVLERYRQRFGALYERKYAWRYGMGISSSVPRYGYQSSKNQRKRLRKLYDDTAFNGSEARAFDSRDEFDLLVKSRDKRRSVVKYLWMRDYDFYNFRRVGKSWKQNKKTKQWM